MSFEKISSRQNPRIRRLVRLRERAARTSEGVFLLEGLREIDRAIKSGFVPVEFYFCPELIRNPLATAVFERVRLLLPKQAIWELSRPAFEKISYRERPEGILAVVKMRSHTLADLVIPKGEPPLFLVAESIEKPGNLGALLRTADSAGCTALICCGDSGTDIYNPNAIRASQGALFSMPLAVASAQEVHAWLSAQNVIIFATAPAAKKTYWECDLRVPAAVLLGTEATGLTDYWLNENAKDDIVSVSIPQRGLADSLNVSMAAAICLFEAVRQRAQG